jgi:hypothetical protein
LLTLRCENFDADEVADEHLIQSIDLFLLKIKSKNIFMRSFIEWKMIDKRGARRKIDIYN